MSDALSRLLILLEGKDEASPAMKKAGESTKSLGNELASMGRIAAGVATGSLGAQLGLSLSEHFKDALTEVQNFGDQVFKLQQRIGGTAESASTLLSVFERFGVSSDSTNRMLTFFQKGMRGQVDLSEANLSGPSFAGTLSELGISATDSAGKFRPINDVLAEVVDKMHQFGTDGQTGARAMALFGRAGAEASAVFNLTKEEFISLQQEAARLGVQLSQGNVDEIRKLSMAHHDLDEATRGLTVQIGLALTPALTEAAKAIAEFAKESNQSGGAFFKDVLNNVKEAFKFATQLKDIWDKLPHTGSQNPDPTQRAAENKAQFSAASEDVNNPGSKAWADHARSNLDYSAAEIGKSLAGLGEAKDAYAAIWNHFFDISEKAPGINPGIALQGAVAAAKRDILQAHDDQMAAAQAKAAELSARVPWEHEGEAGALHAQATSGQDEREARAAKQGADLSRQEQINQLNLADLAGKRALEVIQHETNVLQREDLGLKVGAARAELSLIPIKQQQVDLELKILRTTDQRAQIERDAAVARAQEAGAAATYAYQDLQYEDRLLQAKIKAGALKGQDISQEVSDLVNLRLNKAPDAEVASILAEGPVTAAERAQQRGARGTQLATAPDRAALADLALAAAEKQRELDAVNAQIRTDALSKAPEEANLEARRRTLEDQLFNINQQRQDLTGSTTVNVQLTINEATGLPDWEKLMNDLQDTLVSGLQKAQRTTGPGAPTSLPGARSQAAEG